MRLEDSIQAGTTADRAIIQLRVNRSAPFPPALQLQLLPLVVNTPVFTIGTPTGLPLKYAEGGTVLRVTVDDVFERNPDRMIAT
jgi:hypothetical protein